LSAFHEKSRDKSDPQGVAANSSDYSHTEEEMHLASYGTLPSS